MTKHKTRYLRIAYFFVTIGDFFYYFYEKCNKIACYFLVKHANQNWSFTEANKEQAEGRLNRK